jgi:hypothetical protein
VIVVQCEQGTAEWYAARLGIPTASSFSQIVTTLGKPSKSADGYMRRLLAEHFIGEPAEAQASQFMQRGTHMEKAARARYAMEKDVDVQTVGFCLRDDRLAGCSPDGLVGDDGLVELKCPSAAVHVGYLLDGLEGEYWTQVQGQLLITGRAWCDLCAFNPALPPVIKRIERDEDFLEILSAALDTFIEQMKVRRTALVALGCTPATLKILPGMLAIDERPF